MKQFVSVSLPTNSLQFVLMRKIVMNAAAKRLFNSVTKALDQVFRRRTYRKLVTHTVWSPVT
jgi:hypothetical protein